MFKVVKSNPDIDEKIINQAIDMINRGITEEVFDHEIFGKIKIFVDTKPDKYLYARESIQDIEGLKGRSIYLGSND